MRFSLTAAEACSMSLRLVDLVGDLGDHDLLAVLAHAFDGRARANLELAAPPRIGVDNALPAQDEAAGGEIRPRHHLEDLRQRGVRDAGSAGWWR